MTQASALKTGQPFSDALWTALLSQVSGIIGDTTGSAYGLTLSSSSNTATVGVGRAGASGWDHQVTAPEGLTIPPATSAPRTSLIVLTYNPGDTVDPFPVQLDAVAGSDGAGVPTPTTPPGGFVLPMWQITRAPGTVLSAATVVDLRRWIGPHQVLAVGAPLPSGAALGTSLTQGGIQWVRALSAGSPAWVAAGPQDHTGSVATREGNGIGASYGLTTTGVPIDKGVLFATRPCVVSVQFAIDFIGPAGGTCQVNVQYSVNNGPLTAFPGGTQPTGPLVAGDNPRTIPTGDIQLAAGDSLQLNASITDVTAALSWYAPTFFYTARSSVHV